MLILKVGFVVRFDNFLESCQIYIYFLSGNFPDSEIGYLPDQQVL